MSLFFRSWFSHVLGTATPHRRTRLRPSYRPILEALEDRAMPSLIASQILPLIGTGRVGAISGLPAPTGTTVSVIAPALTASATTPQTVTLTANVGGGGAGTPTGGTVNFNLGAFGTVNNVPVVNGVATAIFTIPVGTAAPGPFTFSATYSGNAGFTGSASSGASNGTLYFCLNGASTRLGPDLLPFAVLAGAGVTNTGPTTIFGDVGSSPNLTFTGAGSVTLNGATHFGDATSILAQTELGNAIGILAGLPATRDLSGVDLGGLTLTPGVYFFGSTAQLTGTLTLNDLGNPAAEFVFQIGSSLTTAPGSRVVFINGGADNVYWQVVASATIDTSTVFAGNILAGASITLNTTASIACGRALAQIGAVTMDTNFIDPAATSMKGVLSQVNTATVTPPALATLPPAPIASPPKVKTATVTPAAQATVPAAPITSPPKAKTVTATPAPPLTPAVADLYWKKLARRRRH